MFSNKVYKRYIYSAINEELGVVKVGVTKQPDERIKELNSCQVPGQYRLCSLYNGSTMTEAGIHELLGRKLGRVAGKRELYKLEDARIINELDRLHKNSNSSTYKMSEIGLADGDKVSFEYEGREHVGTVYGDYINWHRASYTPVEFIQRITGKKPSIVEAKQMLKHKGIKLAAIENFNK